MKISKVSMFAIGGIAILCTLSLIVEAASSFPVSIHLGLSNAAQHISSVEFVDNAINKRVEVDSTREHMHISGANNFFLSEDGSNKITNSTLSSILGGFRNTISRGSSSVVVGGSGNHLTGNNSVIRGGVRNKIEGGSGLAIMGGSGNTIENGSQNSTILGGEKNKIKGNNSVIAGNNSTIEGNNSVALGSGVTVSGNNSFLWSDGTTSQTLTGDGRFVVMSENGMVVNLSGAADGAQLTIGGPIIVTNSDNDSGAICGGGNGAGMIKLVTNKSADSSGDCLCTCNGSGRNSLYGGGRCETMCNDSSVDNSEPRCGNNVEIIPQGGSHTYSGSCEVGSMVKNQIYVDKNGGVHWLCQTLAGTIKCSSGGVVNPSSDPVNPPSDSCSEYIYDYNGQLTCTEGNSSCEQCTDTSSTNYNKWKCSCVEPSTIQSVGVCSPNKYQCEAGTPTNLEGDSSSGWTWDCEGSSSTANCKLEYKCYEMCKETSDFPSGQTRASCAGFTDSLTCESMWLVASESSQSLRKWGNPYSYSNPRIQFCDYWTNQWGNGRCYSNPCDWKGQSQCYLNSSAVDNSNCAGLSEPTCGISSPTQCPARGACPATDPGEECTKPTESTPVCPTTCTSKTYTCKSDGTWDIDPIGSVSSCTPQGVESPCSTSEYPLTSKDVSHVKSYNECPGGYTVTTTQIGYSCNSITRYSIKECEPGYTISSDGKRCEGTYYIEVWFPKDNGYPSNGWRNPSKTRTLLIYLITPSGAIISEPEQKINLQFDDSNELVTFGFPGGDFYGACTINSDEISVYRFNLSFVPTGLQFQENGSTTLRYGGDTYIIRKCNDPERMYNFTYECNSREYVFNYYEDGICG